MAIDQSKTTVRINPTVFDVAPDYALVAILCRGVRAPEGSHPRLAVVEDDVRSHDVAPPDPHTAAWHAAYSAAGISPSRYPNAAAALARRVRREGQLPRLGYVVDLCNAASLTSHLPIASCALDRLTDRRLEVSRADGREVFRAIGAADEERPGPGEVVFRDAQHRAHSRRWNWRQSDQIKTTPSSNTILVTIESVVDDTRHLDTAADLLPDLHEICETAQVHVLHRQSTSARWAA